MGKKLFILLVCFFVNISCYALDIYLPRGRATPSNFQVKISIPNDNIEFVLQGETKIDSDFGKATAATAIYLIKDTNVEYTYNFYHSFGSGGNEISSGYGGTYSEFKVNQRVIQNKPVYQNDNITTTWKGTLKIENDTEITYSTCSFSNLSSTKNVEDHFYFVTSKNFCLLSENCFSHDEKYSFFISIPNNKWGVNGNVLYVANDVTASVDVATESVIKGVSVSQTVEYASRIYCGNSEIKNTVSLFNLGTSNNEIYAIETVDGKKDNSTKKKILSFSVDSDEPMISIEDLEDGRWYTEEGKSITVMGNDDTSGVKRFVINDNGTETELASGTNTYRITGTGLHKITVTAEDCVGHEKTLTYTVGLQEKGPEIKILYGSNGKEYTEGWLTAGEGISGANVKIIPSLSGLKKITITNLDTNTELETSLSETEYTVSKSGKYKILVEDNAGILKDKELKIDISKPEIKKRGDLRFDLENGRIKTIYMDFTVSDDYSITANPTSRCGNNTAVTANPITINNGVYTAAYDVSKVERNGNPTVKLIASIKDAAGNESIVTQPFMLPKIISAKVGSTYISGDNNVTEINIENFDEDIPEREVSIRRVIKYKGAELTEAVYKELFASEVSEDDIKSMYLELTSDREIKHTAKYNDVIPLKSGMGHKKTGYQITWTLKGDNYIVTESADFCEPVKTANSKGTYEFRITGYEANPKSAVIDQNGKWKMDDDFELPETGLVKIAYRITDYDMEDYEVILKELVYKGGEAFKICRVPEEYISTGSTAVNRVLSAGNPGYYQQSSRKTEDGWYEFSEPFALYYNKSTNFILQRIEGDADVREASDEQIMSIKFVKTLSGKFGITVGSEADYNMKGITANPGQDINLSIEFAEDYDTDNVLWKFNDIEKTELIGKEQTFAYGQSPDRTGDTSEYKLEVICDFGEKGRASDEINVHIIDTQYGNIHIDEIWIGKHRVLNRVTVPGDRILTVSDNFNDSSNKTEVLFTGSLNEDENSWLDVKGKLKAYGDEETILFTEGYAYIDGEQKEYGVAAAKNYGWKGIIGTAGADIEMRNCKISFAERGIAVKENSSVDLEDCSVEENEIGIHTYENCKVKLRSVRICNNEEYGIKEDGVSGNVPSVIVDEETKFNGNTIDWYSWDNNIKK